jgi:biopolymer transport protein ExbD
MAGTGKTSDEDGIVTDINVTPLVDVMLCLLVIFMVITTEVVADSIKVDLPRAATGDSTTPSTVAIVYNAKRELYLNGGRTTEEELRQKLKEELALNKELQAIIGADKSVTHGEVIRIIDIVKLEGVTKFALNIENEEPY